MTDSTNELDLSTLDDFAHTSIDWSTGTPTYLANGNVGFQSCSTAIGPVRSFMVGILDLTPSDITRPALLPEWCELTISLGGRIAHLAPECILPGSYRQTLYMNIGEIHTTYVLNIGGTLWKIDAIQFVCRDARGLAVTTLYLTALSGGDVEISFGIFENVEPPRYPFRTMKDVPEGFGGGFHESRMTFRWHPGHMQLLSRHSDGALATVSAAAVAAGNGPSVGMASSVWTDRDLLWRSNDRNGPSLIARDTLSRGSSLVLQRITAFARDDPADRLAQRATEQAQLARVEGVPVLRQRHRAAWATLWKSDIVIEGDDRLQKQARTDLFYLLQSRNDDDRWSMPIFGVASSGYNGGVFWDADVFMFPALLPIQPKFARGVVAFRHRTLSSAIDRAREAGMNGAKYTWESDLIFGEENIAPVDSVLAAGQIHNNAGISLAQWMYFCATGDRDWLRSQGYPVISAIADYWVDRAVWNSSLGAFELLAVYSVEESDGIVNNCAYTNAAAARSLEIATLAAKVLDLPSNPAWSDLSSRMSIPRNQETGLHRSNDDAEGPSLWSSTLLHHPLEWPSSKRERRACLLDPYFWDMSLQAVVAAMCEDRAKMRHYLDVQASRFVRSPFGVRGEQADNDAVPMHTGCGCNLQAWIYGATGLRWRPGGLLPVYEPCLPDGITSLTLSRLVWQNRAWSVVVNGDGITITPIGEG